VVKKFDGTFCHFGVIGELDSQMEHLAVVYRMLAQRRVSEQNLHEVYVDEHHCRVNRLDLAATFQTNWFESKLVDVNLSPGSSRS